MKFHVAELHSNCRVFHLLSLNRIGTSSITYEVQFIFHGIPNVIHFELHSECHSIESFRDDHDLENSRGQTSPWVTNLKDQRKWFNVLFWPFVSFFYVFLRRADAEMYRYRILVRSLLVELLFMDFEWLFDCMVLLFKMVVVHKTDENRLVKRWKCIMRRRRRILKRREMVLRKNKVNKRTKRARERKEV